MKKNKKNKKNDSTFDLLSIYESFMDKFSYITESHLVLQIKDYLLSNILVLSLVKQTFFTFSVLFVLSIFIKSLRVELLRVAHMPLSAIITSIGIIMVVSSIAGMFVYSPFVLFLTNFIFGVLIVLFGIIYSEWGVPYCLMYLAIVLYTFGDVFFEFKNKKTKIIIAIIIFVIGFNTKQFATPCMPLLDKKDSEIYGECNEAVWRIRYNFELSTLKKYDYDNEYVFRVYKGKYKDAKIAAKQHEDYLNVLNMNKCFKDFNLEKKFKISEIELHDIPERVALKVGDRRFNKDDDHIVQEYKEIYLNSK